MPDFWIVKISIKQIGTEVISNVWLIRTNSKFINRTFRSVLGQIWAHAKEFDKVPVNNKAAYRRSIMEVINCHFLARNTRISLNDMS